MPRVYRRVYVTVEVHHVIITWFWRANFEMAERDREHENYAGAYHETCTRINVENITLNTRTKVPQVWICHLLPVTTRHHYHFSTAEDYRWVRRSSLTHSEAAAMSNWLTSLTEQCCLVSTPSSTNLHTCRGQNNFYARFSNCIVESRLTAGKIPW